MEKKSSVKQKREEGAAGATREKGKQRKHEQRKEGEGIKSEALKGCVKRKSEKQ